MSIDNLLTRLAYRDSFKTITVTKSCLDSPLYYVRKLILAIKIKSTLQTGL